MYTLGMVHGTALHPLRKWRLAQGLTLVEAADRLRTTRQSCFEWETGRRIPSPLFMERIKAETGGAVQANHFYEWRSANSDRKAA